MSKSFHAKIADDGRVVIPAALRKQLGLHPGDTVVIQQDGNAVRVSGYAHVLKEIQDYFQQFVEPGRCIVDELIAERRAEAAKEEDELAEWLATYGRKGA